MIFYKCKYRCPGRDEWTKLKKIKGDGIEGNVYRFFVLKDDSMVIIPIDAEVVFDSKRAKSIEEDMNKDSGQKIQRD